MIKTPTYHVFHMYRHHQGAKLLDSTLNGVQSVGTEEWSVPEITESVSKKDGIITITLNNLSTTDDKELDIQLTEKSDYEIVEANVVTNDDMHAHNTFEAPETVKEVEFTAYKVNGNTVTVKLPKCSVVELRIK